ncbi:hypothetical protein WN51_06049 [Melipona quadrifasciata]|uniref:Uncharacterized protein n=1 Tax=Melipona quadrifasciata TaxID=166423 RepID=A0A0M8ZP05_9HYME|nr:hypothetical protein WN51_06049 [Melipona quadrifasciata]
MIYHPFSPQGAAPRAGAATRAAEKCGIEHLHTISRLFARNDEIIRGNPAE